MGKEFTTSQPIVVLTQKLKNLTDMKVPQIVLEAARANGFNRVSYRGEIDGAKAFSVGAVDENGNPIPMGLPTFLLLKNNDISLVSGTKGLDLHIRLK